VGEDEGDDGEISKKRTRDYVNIAVKLFLAAYNCMQLSDGDGVGVIENRTSRDFYPEKIWKRRKINENFSWIFFFLFLVEREKKCFVFKRRYYFFFFCLSYRTAETREEPFVATCAADGREGMSPARGKTLRLCDRRGFRVFPFYTLAAII